MTEATTTATARDVADEFYRATSTDDGPALAGLLHPEFTGRVTAGLPLGLGDGGVRGPTAMLQEVWLQVMQAFDIAPYPDELVEAGPDRIIAFGHYRGHARATGRPLEAAFCHDIGVRDGKMYSLVQITDSRRWHEALDG